MLNVPLPVLKEAGYEPAYSLLVKISQPENLPRQSHTLAQEHPMTIIYIAQCDSQLIQVSLPHKETKNTKIIRL